MAGLGDFRRGWTSGNVEIHLKPPGQEPSQRCESPGDAGHGRCSETVRQAESSPHWPWWGILHRHSEGSAHGRTGSPNLECRLSARSPIGNHELALAAKQMRHSSCSLVRTAPFNRVATIDLSGIASTLAFLKSIAHGQKTMSPPRPPRGCPRQGPRPPLRNRRRRHTSKGRSWFGGCTHNTVSSFEFLLPTSVTASLVFSTCSSKRAISWSSPGSVGADSGDPWRGPCPPFR